MTRHRLPISFASIVTTVKPRIGTSSKIKSFSYPSFVSASPSTLWASFEDPSQLGAQVFEPIVNVPALGSFLVIVVVFSLLQIRISQVNQAVECRKEALTKLRSIKSREISSPDDRPSMEQLQQAVHKYEQAIANEESLRSVMPGIRIVAPNGLASSEEDIRAAKQFLGLDLRTDLKEDDVPGGFSAGAIAVLAIVGISQLALLYMLSFDPMTANQVYTTLGGDPILNL